jgi:hypothetical protein
MPFLWPAGQAFDEALAFAGLSLAEGPLFAIELVPLKPGGGDEDCPVHERSGIGCIPLIRASVLTCGRQFLRMSRNVGVDDAVGLLSKFDPPLSGGA